MLRSKMSLLKFTYVASSRLAKEQSHDFIHRYCVRFILLWLRLPTDSWRLPRTQAWRHQDIWICHFLGLHVDSPDSCGYSVQCIWINSCQSRRRTYAGMPGIPFFNVRLQQQRMGLRSNHTRRIFLRSVDRG